MERLTEWNDEQTRHAYYPRCFEEPCYGGGCKINDCPFETAVCDRLAAYEETGLEPEAVLSATDMAKVACALHELNQYKKMLGTDYDLDRLREIVQADRDGRCVVLPF